MTAVIHGLETSVTYGSPSTGMGIASAFQMLELIHCHYWSPTYSTGISNATSPVYARFFETAAQEEMRKARMSNHMTDSLIKASGSLERTGSSESGTSTLQDNAFETESETGSITDTGSIMANPNFRTRDLTATRFEKSRPKSDGEVDSLTYTDSIMPKKSSLSGRYRFYAGSLIQTVEDEKQEEKTFLFENFVPLTTVRHNQTPVEVNANNTASYSKDRRLNITTVGTNSPSFLWQDLQFWEDLFCDAVAQERDLIGMDTGADELLDRYRSLAENEKRVLENDEDRLLSVILYNLTGFMLLMQVSVPRLV